jgi:hypothetical protein
MLQAQFAGSQLGPFMSFVFFFMPPRDTAENAPLLTNHYNFHVFSLFTTLLRYYGLPGLFFLVFDYDPSNCRYKSGKVLVMVMPAT